MNIAYYDDSPSMMMAVANGNADFLMEDYPVINYQIKIGEQDKLKIAVDSVIDVPSYWLCRRRVKMQSCLRCSMRACRRSKRMAPTTRSSVNTSRKIKVSERVGESLHDGLSPIVLWRFDSVYGHYLGLFIECWPSLLAGLEVTILIAVASLFFAFFIGILLAVIGLSGFVSARLSTICISIWYVVFR